MLHLILRTVIIISLLAPGIAGSAAEWKNQASRNWHQWRGPVANGSSPQGNPPIEWNEKKNIRWKVPVPGEGSSTPIIWEDRLFLLAAVKTDRPATDAPQADHRAKTKPPEHYFQFSVTCLDRNTGRTRWQRVCAEAVPHEGKHWTNTFASFSPTTDGRRLFVSFGSRGIFCLSLDGKVLWKRELGHMRTRYGWGEAASPVIHRGSLVVNWDHEDQSFVTVLDAETGKTRWKVDRAEPSSWATPLVVRFGERDQLIVNGTQRARGYDLNDGKVIWQCGGQTVNAIPSPVRYEDCVICMSGYRGAAAIAVPLSASGDLTDTDRVRWRHMADTPYVPSPVLVDHRLYFTQKNSAVLTCLDARTGKTVYGPQRISGLSNLYASPVAVRGRVYFIDRDGHAVVLASGDEFKVLATNSLEDAFDASPAIVGRQLFLRGRESVYCIEAP